jgi:sensor histidine kinase regulating citrate/malate metabolism
MSRIYDALIKAGQTPDSKPVLSRRQEDDEAGSLDLWWQGVTLDRKIAGVVAAVMLISGLTLVAIVHQLMGRALRAQIEQRGSMVATSLSDSASGYVAGRNVLELHALVTKFARLDGVAYAFIEDRNGRVLAHSTRPLPPPFRKTPTTDERKQVARVVDSEGRAVYEFRASILEGQLGTAQVGLWEDDVKTQIKRALLPVIGAITFFVLVSLIVAVLLVRMIARPIAGPKPMANDASADDLEPPVQNGVVG